MNMNLKIKPLNETAREVYSDHGHFHEGDAGLDLYVLEDITIEPGETKAIKLGVACEPEDGRAYFLMPRSSISKTPLRLANSIGLIDGGYRGELMAMCDNIKGESYTAEKGQRLFQVVSYNCSPIFYELVEELSETTRGIGGFGSTGK
jgi:dUTP pyrophosphatase